MMPARQLRRKILELFIILIGFIFPNNARAQGPLYGEDIHLVIDANVKNVEGVPRDQIDAVKLLAGVSLTAWVYYTHYDETGFPITEYKYSALEASTTGSYSVTINLGDAVFDIHQVGVEINNRDQWLLKYYGDFKITDTHYEIDLYVIPLNDFDGNGIRDDFEWELVKIFCPNLVPNEASTKIYPEPVQILGGQYNSKISVTKSGPWENKIAVGLRASDISFRKKGSSWRNIIPGFGKYEYDARFDYSKFIEENPITLNVGDSISEPQIGTWDYDKKPITQTTFLWIHLDMKGSTTNEWFANYTDERFMNRFPHTIYCTIWEESIPSYPFNKYQNCIQYWFFYPYDDWVNDHEGDWEHINVIVGSQFPERTYLNKVQFYFHELWKEWKRDDPELEIDDGTHVTVYMGGESRKGWANKIFNNPYRGSNSGASYPRRKLWENVGATSDVFLTNWFTHYWDDYVSGEGPKITWSEIINNNTHHPTNDPDSYYLKGIGLILLKDAEYWLKHEFFITHPEYSWFMANIFFGEPAQYPGSHDFAPYPGPFRKIDWRRTGGFGIYGGY